MRPLGELRVVDLSTGIAGGYATKLFVDGGADVVKVEPPGGDPLRDWTASGADRNGDDGVLFQWLNASKRSVVGSLADALVSQLVEGADIVVESFDPGVAEAAGLLDHRGLVVLSLSPWGRGGRLSGRPATDFVIQAECGSLAGRGHPDRPPVQAGGRIAEWAAGIYGAPAALAALRQVRATGRSVHVDVSMVEAMCICTNLYSDLMWSLLGRPPVSGPARSVETPSIEPTADGWVGFNTNAAQMFDDFLLLIGRPDLIEGREWSNMATRWAQSAEWQAMIDAYTRRHTTAEVIEQASELRVPVAPVGNAATVLAHEHFVARDMFGTDPSGRFRAPRPPYQIDGCRPGPETPRPAPAIGQHQDAIEPHQRPVTQGPSAGEPTALPFEGLRVLDVTSWWAGPSATQFFAALGADVIHVEAIQRVDGMRLAAAVAFVGRDRWWEYSSFFLSINPNKRDLTLDLADPEGQALIGRLVSWADVVVENYTPRVVERFGLDWPAVHRMNPSAVMARMPAFGLSGPWRDRPGFAQNMEQMAGLAWVTGYPDRAPLIPRGPCDPLGGMHAAFAIQVAMAERDQTGRGALVEIPLIESALNLAAEQVLEYSAYGTVLGRGGNRSPGAAPQGLYACQGTERWLALSVASDRHWDGLRAALGWPTWAEDPALASYHGRLAAHDDLDEHLGRWAAAQDLDRAVDLLVRHGVPAAGATDPRAVSQHPHLVARGLFETVDHPVVGPHPVITLPFRWTGVERWIRTPAPTLGQHNDEVLGGILGLTGDDLARLSERGVIGDRPVGL